MNPDSRPFQELYEAASKGLEARGMRVVIVDDKDGPFFGDLDGAAVYLGKSQPWENKLFTLVHLAAHNYQWAVDGRYAEIGSQLFYIPDEGLFHELMEYERDAARLSIALLHALRVFHLDMWYSRYSHCDLAFLDDYYRTGRPKALMEYWKDDVEPFQPLPLPEVKEFRQRVKIQKGVVLY